MLALTVGAWSGRQAPTIGGMDDFPSLLGATSTEDSELDDSTQIRQEQDTWGHHEKCSWGRKRHFRESALQDDFVGSK